MPLSKLSPADIEKELATLPGWTAAGDRIRREYRFAGFIEAIAFMSAAVAPISGLDHHPEWSNVYDRVRVELTTHDSGGVTSRDIELARELEALAGVWPMGKK